MFYIVIAVVLALVALYFMLKPHKNLPPSVMYGTIPILSTLLKFKDAPVELLKWAREKYGKFFRINLFGFINMIFVNDAQAVEFFFKAKEDVLGFQKAASFFTDFIFPLTKKHPNDDPLRFHIGKIRDGLTTEAKLREIEVKIADEVSKLVEKWRSTKSHIPIIEDVTRLVVNSNIRSFVSDEGLEYADEVYKCYTTIEEKGTTVTASMFPRWSSNAKEALKAKAKLVTIVEKIVEKRKQKMENPDYIPPNDMLQDAVAIDEDADSIAFRLLATLFAAHVNTVSTNIWTMIHLAQNKQWQDKIHAELNGDLSMDNLKNSQALGACLKETVRAHAVVMLFRFANKDLQFSGFDVPKDSLVMISPALLHSNPEVFENPNEWNPARFDSFKNYGYNFVQWGFGGHRCVGEQYAYIVMRTLLGTVMRNFELTLESEIPKPNWAKLLGMPPPSSEVYIAVKPRSD